MDDRDLEPLGLLAELLLAVTGDEVGRQKAELAAVGLRPEDILQVAVLQDGRGDAGGDPHEFLQLLDPGGGRHALGRGIEAEQHVNALMLNQAHRLVDRDIGLALGIGVGRLELVAGDAALFDVMIDDDLGAERVQFRAAAGERAAVIEDRADLELLRLLGRGRGNSQGQHGDKQPGGEPNHDTHRHRCLPGGFRLAAARAISPGGKGLQVSPAASNRSDRGPPPI